MERRITDVYVVHHSHTDIGYTDLQERVIYSHIDYIRSALKLIKRGYAEESVDRHFKWNCETYAPVERFLREADDEERTDFFDLVRRGNIGISATYLNFNDLVDRTVLAKRTVEMVSRFRDEGISVTCAMNADVNGISPGAREVFLEHGVEFLFTNIHTHHGMYPLYRNQTPFMWKGGQDRQLFVFSGEHYNLGNALGIVHNKDRRAIGSVADTSDPANDPVSTLKANLDQLITRYGDSDYPFSFLVTGVSGVFSDNAPPNPQIIRTIEEFNTRYANEVTMHMVTLDELYRVVRAGTEDVPTYEGDLNDWWVNGVGSTPYAVKHYREAQRMYHIVRALDEKNRLLTDDDLRAAEDNLLLYAEHTWGHSATVEDPYDTMVANLDIRNTSYAARAHESSAWNLNRLTHAAGDILRYYEIDGRLKAVNGGGALGEVPVTFYIESQTVPSVRVRNVATGEELVTQRSSHPRGALITFIDQFDSGEEKIYAYEAYEEPSEPPNTYFAHIGAEGVRDIVNEYDRSAFRLPYSIESEFFSISYEIGVGVTSLYDKTLKRELSGTGVAPFFTPLHERSEIRLGSYNERRYIGRNIRSPHAVLTQGRLVDVRCVEDGPIFTKVRLEFDLPGTNRSSVDVALYKTIPTIHFTYRVAKTLSEEIESLFLPLSLDLPQSEVYIDKGEVPIRPGIDQIPGTCIEYYGLDNGVVYKGGERDIVIRCPDAPLIYAGEMKHHPIRLCSNDPADNHRPIYSWIMNNTWETNFTMKLAGFGEFRYSLESVPSATVDEDMRLLADRGRWPLTFIVG